MALALLNGGGVSDVPDEWTVATLHAHFKELIDANDRRYEQRFKDSQTAIAAALTSAKDAVAAALAASEKAAEKTEVALKEYKMVSNEWRGTVTDLTTNMPTRRDLQTVEAQVHELREKNLTKEAFGSILKSWEEWRAESAKEQETYRASQRDKFDALSRAVSANSERRAGGKMALSTLGAIIVGAVATIIAIATFVIVTTRR
jgi:alpha-L-arabinofuranosidase